ncbi:hypothetical protein BB558_001506 [Smittium angustum]|uniref:Uncharacterized protein n=1 Tax=Smittium angustum TaxID=133377 RepID=A0A2U1JB77_SMIAN|nr:hypothetical protein BB558_001506 [Smittium angustum]
MKNLYLSALNKCKINLLYSVLVSNFYDKLCSPGIYSQASLDNISQSLGSQNKNANIYDENMDTKQLPKSSSNTSLYETSVKIDRETDTMKQEKNISIFNNPTTSINFTYGGKLKLKSVSTPNLLTENKKLSSIKTRYRTKLNNARKSISFLSHFPNKKKMSNIKNNTMATNNNGTDFTNKEASIPILVELDHSATKQLKLKNRQTNTKNMYSFDNSVAENNFIQTNDETKEQNIHSYIVQDERTEQEWFDSCISWAISGSESE